MALVSNGFVHFSLAQEAKSVGNGWEWAGAGGLGSGAAGEHGGPAVAPGLEGRGRGPAVEGLRLRRGARGREQGCARDHGALMIPTRVGS